jgi:hypothetical protein
MFLVVFNGGGGARDRDSLTSKRTLTTQTEKSISLLGQFFCLVANANVDYRSHMVMIIIL